MNNMKNVDLVTVTEDLLKINNIYYKICRLPNSIRAFVTCKSQNILIFINDNLSIEEQRKAFLHELIHVQENHLENYSYTNKYRTLCENYVHDLLN